MFKPPGVGHDWSVALGLALAPDRISGNKYQLVPKGWGPPLGSNRIACGDEPSNMHERVCVGGGGERYAEEGQVSCVHLALGLYVLYEVIQSNANKYLADLTSQWCKGVCMQAATHVRK